MYCSIIFWFGYLSDQSGICTGQPKSARKVSDVRLLFHVLYVRIATYRFFIMYIRTYTHTLYYVRTYVDILFSFR